MTEPSISMALDKSVRSIDQDGHLHVSMARVSRAAVNGYLGREIPDAEKYGLLPDKLYQLFRHPDELKKAASTWAGKPLQEKHIAQSADDHNHETVVGALGDDVEFDGHFLTAPLTVWDGESIKRIQSGEQKELSSAYRYDYDPTPGVFEGVRYDGIMRNLLANHVSLVETGRAGPECVVGDSALPLLTIPEPLPAPTPELIPVIDPDILPDIPSLTEIKIMATRHSALSRQGVLASGALHAFLMPILATDAKIDLNPILKDVTAKNWKTSKPKIKTALDKALEGKLATDADTSGLLPMLDQIQLLAADEDKEDDKDKSAEDEDDDSDEDKKKKADTAKAAEDEEDDDKEAEDADPDDEDEDDKKKPAFLKDKKGAKDKSAKDKAAKDADPEPKVSKSAMDAAISSAVKAATRAAETNTIARLRSIADAEKAVRPYVGELAIACDSAEAVYRIALDAAEVDLDGVPPAAFAAMVKMLPKPGDVAPVVRTRVAMDAATSADMAKRFPGANSLKTR